MFSSLMLWVTVNRFDFSRVLRLKKRECGGEVEMVYRFVCLYTHFRMELELRFLRVLNILRGRKGDQSRKTLFRSGLLFSFSRIIAYEHSNDETFNELQWN
jgi:hypothetical protein